MKCTKSIALSICALATIFTGTLVADSPAVENLEDKSIQITEDGELKGRVFAEVDGQNKPVEAKVTLSSDGVIVDSVNAQADGSFSFPNVEPGSYQLVGAGDGFVGGQAVDVVQSGGCSACSLGLQSQGQVLTEAPGVVYDAPAASCGCSGGGAGFGGGGGLGGGGLLGPRPLLRLGAIGGIIAVATSGDDEDDASPDN